MVSRGSSSSCSSKPHDAEFEGRREPRSPLAWCLGNWALILLVSSGVLVSALGYHLLREKEAAVIRAGFLFRAETQRAMVSENLRQHLDSMQVLRSLFRFSDQVDRREFRGSAGELLRRYPGVQAFQWAPRVPAEQRAAVEQSARDDGIPEFQFRDRRPDGVFVPAAERPVYYPILFTEPRLGNEIVFGYDLANGPNRRVLEKACDSGLITGTERFALMQDSVPGEQGWNLICPVFRDGVEIRTGAERRKHLIGFIQGVFRLPDMFAAAWQAVPEAGVETMVLDVTPGARNGILYHESLAGQLGVEAPVTEAEMRSGLHVEHPLEMAGRQWLFLMRPDPLWLGQQRSLYPEALCLGGLILTTLLGANLHFYRTRTREVSRLVEQRTAELYASEASLQLALQAAHMGTWEWRQDNDQLRLSSGLLQLHGLPPGNFSGGTKSWLERVIPEDRDRVSAEMRARRQPHEIFQTEFRIRREDGEERWLAVTARVLTEGNEPRSLKMTGVARDITEQKAAEAEIHRRLEGEREARLRAEKSERTAEEAMLLLDTIFVTAPVGLAFLDNELRFARVNESIAAINGVPMEEHIGKTLAEINPEVARQAGEHHRSVLETGRPVKNLMLSGIHRTDSDEDGCWIGSYYPVKKGDGPVIGVGIVVVDITELKKAQEDAQQLATAVEQSAEIILILTAKGDVQYVNQAFYRVTGLIAADVLGTHVDRLRQVRLTGNRFRSVAEQINREGFWSARASGERADGGTLTLDVSISPVRTEEGVTHYVVVGHDVSREVVLEEHLRTAQKMEAIGLLAGGIAHDFNNLLQVIEGYTALCLDLPCTAEELPQNLRQVREAASRAAQLTRQLLLFSRRQPMARAEVDLREITANMLKMIRRLIGPQIEVIFDTPPQISAVQADRSQLEQVVLNLCVNARDAMPNGGRLRIELREVELTTAQARQFTDIEPGRYVQLRVEDDGTGIPPEVQKRIFEPFFTTKPGGHGTGLGLSVVYGIIKQHEGIITVASGPDRGTVFDVYLPALGKAAEPIPVEKTHPPVGGSETVLLVEDEVAVRNLTALVLSQAGYHVIQAEDGQKACEIFAEMKDDIDFILMDVIMPRMGGVESWKRISAMRRVPVLFCSGYTGAPGDLPPGIPLLLKPFTSEQMLKAVHALLDKEKHQHAQAPAGR